jgi:hypothetical protein
MKEIVKDYLWTFDFSGINNEKLYKTCIDVEEALKKFYPPIKDENNYNSFTTYYHQQYNLFNFPCPELNKLYKNMINYFPNVINTGKEYYVRCWVNLFEKGKNLDWHSHWNPKFKTYHGFYCVNTEGEHTSHTDYKIPNIPDIITIPSHDGLCVIGKSEGDGHRSSEWLNDGKFRVTIAFDVIPVEVLKSDEKFLYLEVNPTLIHNFIPMPLIYQSIIF